MTITSEQRQELCTLARNIKFKVSATHSPHITLSSKCVTMRFPNDEQGYRQAKAYLQKIARPQESEAS